jgi:hypothetical protein
LRKVMVRSKGISQSLVIRHKINRAPNGVL